MPPTRRLWPSATCWPPGGPDVNLRWMLVLALAMVLQAAAPFVPDRVETQFQGLTDLLLSTVEGAAPE